MTAERDRLAALLHDEIRMGWADSNYPVMPFPPELSEQLADRLIAAGVGFRSVGVEEVIAQAQANLAKSEAAADREITRLRALVEQQPDLDVERLARALHRSYCHERRPMHSDPLHSAASIAAAYREDAG